MMLPPVKAAGGFLDLVKAFLEVGHFGLAHGFLELALEFGGHLARLAHPLPDHAQHARQFLRADGDQRDNRDDANSLHPMSNMKNSAHARPSQPPRNRNPLNKVWPPAPFLNLSCRTPVARSTRRSRVAENVRRLAQTALLPTSDRAAVDGVAV
jgi:hypothetical protein